MREMASNGAVIWLFFSILQAFLVFSGIIPPGMELLSVLLGSNSIGFFLIYVYFMLKRKPKSHDGGHYNQSERTSLVSDEAGNHVEVAEVSRGSRWERWASLIWFITFIIGAVSLLS